MDIEDHDQLRHWLATQDWTRLTDRTDGEPVLRMTTLRGGVSNRTVLVQRSEPGNDDWVIKQGLEKLRVQSDWFCDPARIHREASGLRCLQEILPPGSVPRYIVEDSSEHLLVMQAVPQPHTNWKTDLLAGRIDPDLCRQFGDMLATIHRRSAIEKDRWAAEFDDRQYFESLRLEPYYAFTAQQTPVARPFLNRLLDQTRSFRQTLVHGDFSPKNILVHGNRLVLLDHEVIHWGDPAFDVGFALTHLLSKAHHLPQYRDALVDATRTVWRTYHRCIAEQPWANGIEIRSGSHLLGCLLARVRGRSPLEYLTDDQREAQCQAVTRIMADGPHDIDHVITNFLQQV